MMAYATQITIGTGSKVSVNYQSQEVHVGVTYQLERDDENLLQLVESKAAEVEAAHKRLWKTLRANQAEREQSEAQGASDALPERYEQRSQDYNGHSNGHQSQNGQEEHVPSVNGYTSANGSNSRDDAITEAQERAVFALTRSIEMDKDELSKTLRMRFDKFNLLDLTKRQASQFIDELQRKQRVKEGR